jgi:murein endopeptidase
MLGWLSRRLAPLLAASAVLLAAAAAVYATSSDSPPPPAEIVPAPPLPPPQFERIEWRRSIAIGRPWAGRLINGVRLPAEGEDFFTWDPVEERSPNRWWRRWGTSRLIRVVLRVLREHRAAYPFAPRVGVGDLSRPNGGNFGRRFGGIGHASHQNGLDVDLFYPRLDGLERQAYRVRQIDLELAQDLVDRFIDAGAEWVFVGPHTDLTGPRGRVAPLVHHDDHLHVRIRPGRGR